MFLSCTALLSAGGRKPPRSRAEGRVMPSRNKNRGERQSDIPRLKLKTSYSLPLEFIWESLSSILCFLFFPTQRKKHPVPGTESDVSWFYFQPCRRHCDHAHNSTITGFLTESPVAVPSSRGGRLRAAPPSLPALQCCRQSPNWTTSTYEVCWRNAVPESP